MFYTRIVGFETTKMPLFVLNLNDNDENYPGKSLKYFVSLSLSQMCAIKLQLPFPLVTKLAQRRHWTDS